MLLPDGRGRGAEHKQAPNVTSVQGQGQKGRSGMTTVCLSIANTSRCLRGV